MFTLERNVIEMEDENRKVLFFENADIYDNQLFFVDYDITFLFSFSFLDEKVRVISKIPELPLFFQRAFGAVTACNGKIYLAPQLSDKLRIYDIKSGKWESIKIGGITDNSLQFRCMASLNNKLYIAGYDEGGLLCVDENNYSIQCLNSKDKFGLGYECVGNYLFFPLRERNIILKVDTNTNEIEEIEIDYENGFCDIAFYNGTFYLAPEHMGYLLCCDYQMNDYTNRVFHVKEVGERVSYISGLARCGSSLRLFTRHIDRMADYNEGIVTMIEGPSMCCFAENLEGDTCVSCKLFGAVTKIDKDNSRKEWLMYLSEEELKKACFDNGVNICRNQNTILYESGWLSLDYVLKSLVES